MKQLHLFPLFTEDDIPHVRKRLAHYYEYYGDRDVYRRIQRMPIEAGMKTKTTTIVVLRDKRNRHRPYITAFIEGISTSAFRRATKDDAIRLAEDWYQLALREEVA